MAVPVLFVDDEEDIRFSFEVHFEGQFPIHLAGNGREGADILDQRPEIGVVVTDIRMPEMNGLDFIRHSREKHPDVGFIVVSGHGEAEQIIEALQLGARNYLRKPYNLVELEEAINQEARRFQIFKDERNRRETEQSSEHFVTQVDGLTYSLPNDLALVAPVAFKMAQTALSVGVIDENESSNVALSLIEIITNAIEHGNLEITGDEKTALKSQDESEYLSEFNRRAGLAPYKDRTVSVTAQITSEEAVFCVEDGGNGFDYKNLPDPTHPDYLFLPNGRGILLASTFMDNVEFLGKGNAVRLTKKKSASDEQN